MAAGPDRIDPMSTLALPGPPTARRLPGDLAMWIFILAELTVFALLFLAFAVTRRLNEAMFVAGQQTLHTGAGLVNTVALLSSSYLVVRGVRAIGQDRAGACAGWLWAATGTAAIYLFAKGWEYAQLFEAGYDLDTNTFFHFMHVLLGMLILVAVAIKAQRGAYSARQHAGVDTGASYWHMVDLVWVILFPLVYVIHR